MSLHRSRKRKNADPSPYALEVGVADLQVRSRELGYRQGAALGRRREGLESLKAELKGAWLSTLREVTAALEKVALLKSYWEKRAESLADRNIKTEKELEAVETLRKERPADFALLKALLYLALSLLLVLADVSIVGQVLARLLGYAWRVPGTNVTFSTLFFADPLRAFADFPDLFCLTLSVLVIGLFIKVWFDALEVRLREGKDSGKIVFLKVIVFSLFFLLSVLAVTSLAGARLTIPIGNAEGSYPRVVAFILGLALPFVSAGFFVRGYDVISMRLELASSRRKKRRTTRQLHRAQKKLSSLQEQTALLQARAKALRDEEGLEDLVANCLAFYSSGYQSGVLAFLAQGAGTSLAEKLRSVLVARIAN